MALNAATRYVRAAQRNDSLACSSCTPCKVRLEESHAKARSEALYSTGRVTIEKTADMAIMAIPIQHTAVPNPEAIIAMPAMITHVAMRDEKFTTGTNAERMTRGA